MRTNRVFSLLTNRLESRVGKLSQDVGPDPGSEVIPQTQGIASAHGPSFESGPLTLEVPTPLIGPSLDSAQINTAASDANTAPVVAESVVIVKDAPNLIQPASVDPKEEGFSLLDPKSIQLERLYFWIATIVVAVVLTVGWAMAGFVVRESFDWYQWLLLVPIGAVVVFCVYLGRVMPTWQYENCRWRVAERGIEIQRGIWWRHRIFVAMDRIQHTDVQQGPLMRWYGLATLVVSTGGTHEPSIPLSGLSLDVAERVRDRLTNVLSSETPVHGCDSGGV